MELPNIDIKQIEKFVFSLISNVIKWIEQYFTVVLKIASFRKSKIEDTYRFLLDNNPQCWISEFPFLFFFINVLFISICNDDNLNISLIINSILTPSKNIWQDTLLSIFEFYFGAIVFVLLLKIILDNSKINMSSLIKIVSYSSALFLPIFILKTLKILILYFNYINLAEPYFLSSKTLIDDNYLFSDGISIEYLLYITIFILVIDATSFFFWIRTIVIAINTILEINLKKYVSKIFKVLIIFWLLQKVILLILSPVAFLMPMYVSTKEIKSIMSIETKYQREMYLHWINGLTGVLPAEIRGEYLLRQIVDLLIEYDEENQIKTKIKKPIVLNETEAIKIKEELTDDLKLELEERLKNVDLNSNNYHTLKAIENLLLCTMYLYTPINPYLSENSKFFFTPSKVHLRLIP